MSRLFRGITDEARQLILTSALPLTLKKGQRLFERGDPGGTMYVVVDGRIEIWLFRRPAARYRST
jgi:CRP-like cAMP-binding protein